MFLITTAYQKARSRRRPDKPGKVLFRIFQNPVDGQGEGVRTVSSKIYGERESVFDMNRDDIVRNIRIIYVIIQDRTDAAQPFSVDDIAEDFRLAINGDESMKALVMRAQEDFPVRADLVSIGNEFKRDFRFVYPEPQAKSENLLEYFTTLSQRAKNNGKQSNARSYSSTRSSLAKFLCDKDVQIASIDRPFIENYSSWLKENGVCDSTQSFYLRTLRSALNHAKEDGITTVDDALFKGLNTRVNFSSAKEKGDTLSRETLNKLLNLRFKDDPEAEMVRDMFMFGFHCRGMELIDVVSLTKSCIEDGKLTYRRRSNGLTRTITLDKSAREIISKYQTSDGKYLFPLSDMYRGLQQYSVTNIVRRKIKQLGNEIGFPQLTFSMNITTWHRLMDEFSISDIVLGSA